MGTGFAQFVRERLAVGGWSESDYNDELELQDGPSVAIICSIYLWFTENNVKLRQTFLLQYHIFTKLYFIRFLEVL